MPALSGGEVSEPVHIGINVRFIGKFRRRLRLNACGKIIAHAHLSHADRFNLISTGSESIMTNIAICGANGKMGKTIYNCIQDRDDCKVVAGIDLYTEQYADFPIVAKPSELPVKPDVIIDFSNPASLDGLLEYCLSTGTPIVVASTGYSEEQIAKIKSAAEQVPVFFTFNMSLGINLLVDLAKRATKVLGDQFDIEIVEKHHNQKLDAPSGTALALADSMKEVLDDDYFYRYDRSQLRQKRDPKEIGISAVRGGTIVGEHEVIFAGEDEVIEFKHTAHSKAVFAKGAVEAAKFLAGKPAGMYDMRDVIAAKN